MGDTTLKTEREIRERIEALEAVYDSQDPPSSPLEDEMEVAVLRAIEELEWVLGERSGEEDFTT